MGQRCRQGVIAAQVNATGPVWLLVAVGRLYAIGSRRLGFSTEKQLESLWFILAKLCNKFVPTNRKITQIPNAIIWLIRDFRLTVKKEKGPG
jgi:hypothetical protein